MTTAPLEVGLFEDSNGRGPSIQLSDGGRFYILDPRPAEISPVVIARSLSRLCRFTGHTKVFYSVAQHCVVVSKIVPPELAIAGLMHDASEAFIGDLSRPLKDALEQEAPGIVRGVEDRIHAAIAERFGFGFPHVPEIKDADNVALATEFRDVMPPTDAGRITNLPDPLPRRIRPFGPAAARHLFLRRLRSLGVRY